MLVQLQGKSEEEKNVLIEMLIQDVRKACQDKNRNAHRDALWRATAMLVNTPGIYICLAVCAVLAFSVGTEGYSLAQQYVCLIQCHHMSVMDFVVSPPACG
jgi:hypothetical protein